MEGDDVLRGGDGRGGAADIRGEGDSEDESFDEGGVGGEVTQEGLACLDICRN